MNKPISQPSQLCQTRLRNRNLATFTTRQWIEEKKPILHVVHDDDGDWQFLTGDQMPNDIELVALEELVLRDKTLNEIFDLEYGEEAQREFVGENGQGLKWNMMMNKTAATNMGSYAG